MDPVLITLLIAVGLSIVTILADSLIKHASLQIAFEGWKYLLLGAIIYGGTAIGWFYIMRNTKLSTVGVLYSISTVICLTLLGVLYFKEKISSMEIVGIILAIISLIIMARFAG